MALKHDRFISYQQVAEMIGLSYGTLRNGDAGTDEIPRVKIGHRVLFSQHAVEVWMKRKARDTEVELARSRDRVLTPFDDKERRQRAVQDAINQIINGAKK
jgi:predicted DNA-binding transcriptional regulator AlpA